MPIKRKTESIVTNILYSIRLDLYLAERFDYLSRSAWQKEIQKGLISVNGKVQIVPSRKISNNDIICYDGARREEPEIDKQYKIIYNDNHMIIVSKSGNIPVHPSGTYFNNTLLSILELDFALKLYPVHRLDRETSGIIVFAKSPSAASTLQKSLNHSIKTYVAIVHGHPPENFSVNVPIGNSSDNLCVTTCVRKKRLAFDGAPEKAKTIFKTMLHFDQFAVIRAYPETGRLHQIRVHLNHIGFPIVGDKIYGLNEKYYLEFIEHGMTDELKAKLFFERCALHALNLQIEVPWNKNKLSVNAPIPEDMKNFIKDHGIGKNLSPK